MGTSKQPRNSTWEISHFSILSPAGPLSQSWDAVIVPFELKAVITEEHSPRPGKRHHHRKRKMPMSTDSSAVWLITLLQSTPSTPECLLGTLSCWYQLCKHFQSKLKNCLIIPAKHNFIPSISHSWIFHPVYQPCFRQLNISLCTVVDTSLKVTLKTRLIKVNL